MKSKTRVSAKERLQRLRDQGKTERGKISFYLSTDLYEDFKKACGDVPVYKVMEDFMREFVADLKGKK